MNYSDNYVKSYVSKLINKKSMPTNANIAAKIDYFPLEAVKQDISDWSDARLTALDPTLPDWTPLIRVYEDVMIDAHLFGIIRGIKKKIRAKAKAIYDKDGEVIEDLTEIFQSEWFDKFMDAIIESDIYPYSVIQLGDWDDGFEQLQQIKREYFVPQFNLIKKSLFLTYNKNSVSVDGYNLSDPKYGNYFVVAKSDDELGLLDHVSPLVLGKKHMLIYWWRLGEQFGLPFRIGRTDTDDPKRRKQLENAFTSMGNNMWIVADIEDQIELLTNSENGSSVNVFLENLKYSNNEISKAVAGAVGIFDEKSFVGSAEAGERIFEDIINSYCRKIENYTQKHLLPKIINSYKDSRFLNVSFAFEYEDNVSFEQKIKVLDTLAKYYDLNMDEIQEKFGFSVSEKNEVEKLANRYKQNT